MKFDILTLFPAMFDGPLTESILKRACENGLIEVALHNIRDWALDKHATADDSPYGGGAGMVMKVEPMALAIESVKLKSPGAKVILTTPCGRPFNHQVAEELSREGGVILLSCTLTGPGRIFARHCWMMRTLSRTSATRIK